MINPGLMAYNVLEQRAKAVGGPNAFCDLLYRQGLEKGIFIGEKTGCTRNLLVGLIAGGLLGGVSSFCLQGITGLRSNSTDHAEADKSFENNDSGDREE